jgi:hypothetical protein
MSNKAKSIAERITEAMYEYQSHTCERANAYYCVFLGRREWIEWQTFRRDLEEQNVMRGLDTWASRPELGERTFRGWAIVPACCDSCLVVGADNSWSQPKTE